MPLLQINKKIMTIQWSKIIGDLCNSLTLNINKYTNFSFSIDDDEDFTPQEAHETLEPASSSWLRCVLQ